MSSRTIPSLFGRATTVLGEHARLRETLALLTVDSSPPDARAADARFHELVERCTDELIEHFAAEEAEGYFGTLLSDCPRLSSTIMRLELEHEEMRREILDIRGLTRVPGKAQESDRRIRALVARVQAHERAENLLLQEFFLRDEGYEPS